MNNIYERNKRISESEFLEGKVKLQSFPRVVLVHTTDTCNLGCVGCHFGQKTAPKITITERGYQRLFNIFPYLELVAITGAETFYDAGNSKGYVQNMFDEGIRHPNLRFAAYTNGLLLTQERINMIINNFNIIGISIDSPDPEVYKTIRVGSQLHLVVENVKAISGAKIRKKLGRFDKPEIMLNFIVIQRTYKKLVDMVLLAYECGAKHITLQVPWQGTYIDENIFMNRDKAREYLSLVKEAKLKAKDLGIQFHERTRNTILKNMPDLKDVLENPEERVMNKWPDCCKAPWSEIYIRENGDAYVCCTSPTLIGNINNNDIFEIWNSPEVINTRKRILSGNYSKDCNINCVKAYMLPLYRRRNLFQIISDNVSKIGNWFN
jgi:MoaA/NifB/PqqE/SkfB family radical SAM enzyme